MRVVQALFAFPAPGHREHEPPPRATAIAARGQGQLRGAPRSPAGPKHRGTPVRPSQDTVPGVGCDNPEGFVLFKKKKGEISSSSQELATAAVAYRSPLVHPSHSSAAGEPFVTVRQGKRRNPASSGVPEDRASGRKASKHRPIELSKTLSPHLRARGKLCRHEPKAYLLLPSLLAHFWD